MVLSSSFLIFVFISTRTHRIINTSYHSRRAADCYHIFGNILCDHRACTNNGIISDRHSRKDSGILTYNVQYILTNERYIGNMLLQKTYIIKSIPAEKRLGIADNINKDKDSWIHTDNQKNYTEEIKRSFWDTLSDYIAESAADAGIVKMKRKVTASLIMTGSKML